MFERWRRSRAAHRTVLDTERNGREPVTQLRRWDRLTPVGPETALGDLAGLQQQIASIVAEHAAAGSLDDAYGDLLDRVIHPDAEISRDRARAAHAAALITAQQIEAQGTEHQYRLGIRVARLRHKRQLLIQEWAKAYAEATGDRLPQEGDLDQLPSPIGLPQSTGKTVEMVLLPGPMPHPTTSQEGKTDDTAA